MRRPTTVELMLLATIVLWALNLTVGRYVLTHGFEPLAYSSLRFAGAALIFVALVLALEGSLRLDRGSWAGATVAVALLVANQVALVYALERTTASTVALIVGATPILAGLIALAVGLERPDARFWAGAAASTAGVGLIATGGGDVSGNVGGNLLAVLTAASWAGFSVAITPLMQRHSPLRLNAVMVIGTAAALLVIGSPQIAEQDFALGARVWALFAFSVVGPLVLASVMWFRVLRGIGPARATLAANLHPFVAALFALVFLSETLSAADIAGGVLIAAGIALAGRRRTPVTATPAD